MNGMKLWRMFPKDQDFLDHHACSSLLVEGKKLVYTDASNFNWGIVLMHSKNVIAYSSRQLKVHDKNSRRMI